MSDSNQTPEQDLFAALDQWKLTFINGILDLTPLPPPQNLEALLNCMLIRLLWLKLCEKQGSLAQGTLLFCSQSSSPHQQWCQLFEAIAQYDVQSSATTPHVHTDKTPILPKYFTSLAHQIQPVASNVKEILIRLHDFTHPALTRSGSDFLGLVYEHLLEHPTHSDSFGTHSSRSSLHAKKARGIYYTPAVVVKDMITRTVGQVLHTQTIHAHAMDDRDAIAPITILDPACGAGAFLVQAYQLLLKWYQEHFSDVALIPSFLSIPKHWSLPCPHPTQKDHVDRGLSWETKQYILYQHIYGVDIDPQAVEITRLSLLLVLFEGFDVTPHTTHRSSPTVDQHKPLQFKPLKHLTSNIHCGNAVIGPDIIHDSTLHLSTSELLHLHPFDWKAAFPIIWNRGGFDIVLGNPPYIDAEWMTRSLPIERYYCSKVYTTASGNWDFFCVFCEKALQVCRENGLTSFIVPNKLGAAKYAQSLRHLLTVDNQLLSLQDYSETAVFPIAVYPLVYIVQKTKPIKRSVQWEKVTYSHTPSPHFGHVTVPPSLRRKTQSLDYLTHFSQPKRSWAIATNNHHQDLLNYIRHQDITLGDIATVVGSATVAEAYALKPLLYEASSQKAKSTREDTILPLKFINSGTIDCYRALWGQKPVRYLGDRYQAPVIPRSLEDQLPHRRQCQARHPKLIVASMTLSLEGMLDNTGEFLAGKSTTIIQSTYDLRYLLAILNSTLMRFYYRTAFSGNALKGGYLQIGPPQLKPLPIVIGTTTQQHIIINLVDTLLTQQQTTSTFSSSSSPMTLPFSDRNLNSESSQHQPLTPHEVSTSAIAHQIDHHVTALYGLSPLDFQNIDF